jgi:uncharacterized protein
MMPATSAANLRELHALHQRAKALRDRLISGPKTLATRQAVLASRRAALEEARKALKDRKAQVKLKESQLQGIQAKSDDLRVKLNQVKKQDEYNAIMHQLASDRKNVERLEVEILEAMEANDAKAAELAALEADVQKLDDEVAAFAREIESKAGDQGAQLQALEAAITEAEAIIPEDQRDQYRRVVKQRGADALAPAEGGACSGCYVSVTTQMMNELINCHHLVFCKSCGRILYLPEEDHPHTRRGAE